MSVLERLEEIEIFKDLTLDQRRAIGAGCEEQSFRGGERLFAEGEEAAHLWVLTEGEVDLRFDLPGRSSSPQNTILTVGRGQALGWSSLVPPYEYKLSAYCAGESCTVLRIEKQFLLELFNKDPVIGYRIVRFLNSVASLHFQQLQGSDRRLPPAITTVTVHLATCGIAAGAREVLMALMEEAGRVNRQDIEVKRGRCIGQCKTEPNVTVEISGEDPVVYQKMTAERMREVFQKHVLDGEVQAEYLLHRG
ncbi:MAG: cyclic nucleotide-binding domain-containing protein [Thermodesulfobacteriota bacterium]